MAYDGPGRRQQRGHYRGDDRYESETNGPEAAYAIAAIRWIGIVAITVIIAYVVLRITGTIEGIVFTTGG